jgi:hypothetical protein
VVFPFDPFKKDPKFNLIGFRSTVCFYIKSSVADPDQDPQYLQKRFESVFKRSDLMSTCTVVIVLLDRKLAVSDPDPKKSDTYFRRECEAII